uniref:F-box/kelch-repeat protein At3g06240 family n=2 Tax=Cajanus cajan TaxID=3821 RepID=A0A151SAC4_CAJCA|nr:F-box/kelch-repeat protein At3g06240 family [Cajanus cajan]
MCASKSLRSLIKSLISNPSLVKLQLERSRSHVNANLLCEMRDSLVHHIPLFRSSMENPSSSATLVVHPSHEHRIIGSCNGLICYAISSPSREKYVFYLWNPVTGLTAKHSPPLLLHYHFVSTFGFGYDRLSDTYKVVVPIYSDHCINSSFLVRVKVCNMGDARWRNIQLPITCLHLITPYGLYLRGTLSWLTFHPSRENQYLGISLDLTNETFTHFMLPPYHDVVGPMLENLGTFNDSLSFSYNSMTHFVAWQMKELGYQNSWTQLFRIETNYLNINSPMLRLTPNGGILIMSKYGKYALLYNQRDNQQEYVKISADIRHIFDMDYTPTLVSPCSS